MHIEVMEMQTDKMDLAFETYLESQEYDKAEGLLLSILRKAFQAGWNAAADAAADTKASKM